MKVAVLNPSNIRHGASVRLSLILTTVLFYLAKKWNKHNKFLNFWLRSQKDLQTFGPVPRATVDMSKDGRARIRFHGWVIYIGYSVKPTK